MDLQVKSTQVISIARRAIAANQPCFLWGAPGIGKSDVVRQVADEIGNSVVIDMRLALMEPTDLRGYPFRNLETNQMEWAPPADLPTDEFASQYEYVILFLDELNSAPPSVQAAAYQLVLNGRVGQYVLPKNVRIIAAGNRETDRGVTYRMPAPLANRFRHINMTHDFGAWMTWALLNEVHPDVIGYLSYAKQDLFDFDPKTSSQAFATPRSWSVVSGMIAVDGFDTADIFEQKAEIAGAVGEGMAAKFIEHRRISGTMPNPEDILNGKVKKLNPKLSSEISAKYSLVVGLTYEVNEMYKENGTKGDFKEKFNNAVRFAYDNFDPEMVVLLFKTIMTDYKIRFNIRTDLDKDVYKVFSERYTKYIV
tara:strand:+ start:7187 stop:8284 length:1098 start_codon:yes stop_codon:yes gene_type:complete